MIINMKAPLMAAAIGFGLVTVAHAAQPAPQPSQRQPAEMPAQSPMMRNMPMAPGAMMNDPKMRGQMSEMMRGCHRMMAEMANMPDRAAPAR